MKHLRCSTITGTLCTFVAEGETAEEVKRKMIAHKKSRHRNIFKHATVHDTRRLQDMMDRLLSQGVADS